MKLNELSASPGSNKQKKRLGRGIGSGKGKTAGRGHKGQKARSGVALKGFEGGQMPFYRRLPKRGFTNIFRKEYDVVNVGTLQKGVDGGILDSKKTIDQAALKACGLARGRSAGVRILAHGEVSVALDIDVAGASKAAIEAIEKAGGKIKVLPPVDPDLENKKKAARTAQKAGGKAKGGASRSESADSQEPSGA